MKKVVLIIGCILLLFSCLNKRKTENTNKIFNQIDSIENVQLLDTNLYNSIVKYDSVYLIESDYFGYKGISFSTKKSISKILKFIESQYGKPEIIKNSNYQNNLNYEWTNNSKYRIEGFYQNKDSIYHEMRLYWFDSYNQIITDSVFLKSRANEILNIINKERRFSFSYSKKDSIFRYTTDEFEFPINFDSVQINLLNRINYKELENISIKLVVNNNGDVLLGRTDFNSENLKDSILIPIDKLNQVVKQYRFKPIKDKFPQVKKYIIELKQDDFENFLNEKIYQNFRKNFFNISKQISDTGIVSNDSNFYFKGEVNQFNVIFSPSMCIVYLPNGEIIQEIKTGDNWISPISEIYDFNNDGYDDILLNTPPNMNGNVWTKLCLFDPNKMNFKNEGEFVFLKSTLDEDIPLKKGYFSTFYTGSWYMPNITTVYKWDGLEYFPVIEIGTELLYASQDYKDYTIMFINEFENGKFIKKRNQTFANGEFDYDKFEKIIKEKLKKYQ